MQWQIVKLHLQVFGPSRNQTEQVQLNNELLLCYKHNVYNCNDRSHKLNYSRLNHNMAHGNFGLSLLSRGVGEQRHSGKSQKVEVLLEPEDYFNIQRKGYYLPPIHHQAWTNEELSPRTVHAHKTYTTRKGALLLYAEDLALSYPSEHRPKAKRKSLEAEDSKYFNTMKDLRSAILSYGAKDQQEDNVFMGFNNSKMNNFNSPRSVRPGFSAKRYLANWSKSWDDSILNYLRSEGHLWDKNLFESNSVMPSMYRRINDDMSHVPPPYRVTRNMLISPGDIVTYEFYRIRPDDMEYGSGDRSGHLQQPHPSPETGISSSGMIAAIARDGEKIPHPVVYSQLDRSEQQLVLQKLILQGAAHHNQGRLEDVQEDLHGSQVMMLDMNQAIANLVTSNSENLLAGGNVFSIPEVPTEEPYTDSTPSESSWPDVVEKVVYEEVAPQILKSASFSAVQPLPPIATPKQQTLDLKGSAQSTVLSHGQVDFKLPEIGKGVPLPGISAQVSNESIQDLKRGKDGDVVSNVYYSEVNLSESEEDKGHDDFVDNKTVTQSPQQTGSRHTGMSNERKESGSRLSSGNQLSQSFEDLSLADEQLTSMKGGVVPKNRTESMRSYKKSRGKGSAGSSRSDILQGDEDAISVIGSVISAPSERAASGEAGLAKEALSESKEKAVEETQEHEENAYEKEKEDEKASISRGPVEIPTGSDLNEEENEHSDSQALVTDSEKIWDSKEAMSKEGMYDSQMAISENEGSFSKDEDACSLKDREVSSRNDVAPSGDDQVGGTAEVREGPASLASGKSKNPSAISQELDGASVLDGASGLEVTSELGGESDLDGASRVDGKSGLIGTSGLDDASGLEDAPGQDGILQVASTSELDNASGLDGAFGLEGASGLDGTSGLNGTSGLDGAAGQDGASGVDGTPVLSSGDADGEPSSDSPHQEVQSSQKLPTASIGSDLTEDAPVSENSFPKSKRRTSIPSEAGSVRSLQDGIFSLSEFFTNFSYASRQDSDRSSWWSGRGSMPSSLASDADDTEIASLEEDNSETGDDWPQVDEMNDQVLGGPSTAQSSSGAEKNFKHDEIDSQALPTDDSVLIQNGLPSADGHSGLESDTDLMEEAGSNVASRKSDGIARSRQSSSRASSLMDQLEEEAAAIAEAVLQRPKSGRDLAEDAQLAAALWRERLGQLFQVARPPPDDTQSMIERRRKNSFDGSSVASLDVGHWDGSDLRTGRKHRSRRDRRVSSAQATVDLIDDSPANEVPPSAPQQKVSGGDSLQLDVTNFGVGDRADVSTKSSQRRDSESKEDEELKKIVEDTGLLSRASEAASSKKSKGSKSSKSQKSDKSSTKSGKSQKSGKDDKNMEKTKEFVVSMPHDDKQDYLAYKPAAPEPEEKIPQETGKAKPLAPKPPKKPKKEKTKKVKKPKKTDAKKEEPTAVPKKDEDNKDKHPVEPAKEKEEETTEDKDESRKDAEPQKEDGNVAEKSEEENDEEEEGEAREEVESPEFIIIHEEFSDSEPEEEEPKPLVEHPSVMESHEDANMSEVETEYTEDSSHRPGSLSRSQARAAKRAAENERKKREIDRKRREKEEARRKAQEEQERKERIMREFEEERHKKEEQIRLKKEAEEEAKRRAEQAQKERARQAELAAERERKQQEEYKRKLEELAKKKKEEDRIKQEMEAQRLKEEAERKKEEEEMLAKMAEEERLEYERRKQEEELLAQIKAEEERVRRELEAKLAQEEAERLALEMAKRQKELEIRMKFNRELNAEANIFAHSQEMTRAFTWSYFELLEYLGIPIPDHLREKYLKGQLVPKTHGEVHEDIKDSGDS